MLRDSACATGRGSSGVGRPAARSSIVWGSTGCQALYLAVEQARPPDAVPRLDVLQCRQKRQGVGHHMPPVLLKPGGEFVGLASVHEHWDERRGMAPC